MDSAPSALLRVSALGLPPHDAARLRELCDSFNGHLPWAVRFDAELCGADAVFVDAHLGWRSDAPRPPVVIRVHDGIAPAAPHLGPGPALKRPIEARAWVVACAHAWTHSRAACLSSQAAVPAALAGWIADALTPANGEPELAAILWELSHLTPSGSRVDPRLRYRVRRAPDRAWLDRPGYARLAELLSVRACDIDEASSAVGVPRRAVMTFLDAMLALDAAAPLPMPCRLAGQMAWPRAARR